MLSKITDYHMLTQIVKYLDDLQIKQCQSSETCYYMILIFPGFFLNLDKKLTSDTSSFFVFVTHLSSSKQLLQHLNLPTYFFLSYKLAARSNQCSKHHCGQPVENYEQSKICSDWPEEQLPMEHEKHHVLNNEHHIVDKNNGNPQNREVVLLKKNFSSGQFHSNHANQSKKQEEKHLEKQIHWRHINSPRLNSSLVLKQFS